MYPILHTITQVKIEGAYLAEQLNESDEFDPKLFIPKVTVLLVEQGRLHLRYKNELVSIHPGMAVVLPKNHFYRFIKCWTEEQAFHSKSFFLDENLLKQLPSDEECKTIQEIIVPFSVENKLHIGQTNILQRTEAVLIALSQQHENAIGVLQEAAKHKKADIASVMEYYFKQNLSIGQLAGLSGRSISTFMRDFKQCFNTTPHKWLMHKRLLATYEILSNGNRRATDIFEEYGFESLAHFSRAFKQKFGIPPSQLVRS